MLLELGLADEIVKDAQSVMFGVRDGIREDAYSISIDFQFNINGVQLSFINPWIRLFQQGGAFCKNKEYLKEKYKVEEVLDTDLRVVGNCSRA